MAFTNQDIDKASLNEDIKRQLRVMRQCPVIFNSTAFLPSESVWNITVNDMYDIMTNIVATYLGRGEVQYVTIDVVQKRPPMCLIWLKKNSKHLIDQSTDVRSQASAIPYIQIDKYSDAFKRFCDQFAPDRRPDGTPINRKKRIQFISNSSSDRSIIGVKVDFEKFLNRIFDVQNKAFLETFGSDAPSRPCQISAKGQYDRNGNIMAFRVTKKYRDPGSGRIRPVAAFADRDRERDDFATIPEDDE